jgi:hypothetical protein
LAVGFSVVVECAGVAMAGVSAVCWTVGTATDVVECISVERMSAREGRRVGFLVRWG